MIAETEIVAEAPARRRRASNGTSRNGAARRHSSNPESMVSDLGGLVDRLIAENRELKRQVAKLEAGQGSSSPALVRLHRSLTKHLGSSASQVAVASPPAAAKRTRRKITDPALLERRREALAKARLARAAKRAAAEPMSD